MSNLGNKEVFAKNLKYYVRKSGKSQKEISDELGVRESSFSDWVTASSYPRIDKIEKLALFFGINKSDLIEDRNGYYINGETKRIAQEILEKPGLRALFDASRNATPEDLEITRSILEQLKRKEKGE